MFFAANSGYFVKQRQPVTFRNGEVLFEVRTEFLNVI
jgi:hypothetical protein